MPDAFAEVLPLLHAVEHRRLLPDRAPRTHRVVPDHAREHERDGELDRLGPERVPDDDQKRRDERRMRARHAAGPEHSLVPVPRADSLRDDFRHLAEQPDDRGNKERVETEEGHRSMVPPARNGQWLLGGAVPEGRTVRYPLEADPLNPIRQVGRTNEHLCNTPVAVQFVPHFGLQRRL